MTNNELLSMLLILNGMWAIFGPLVVYIIVFWLRVFQPKYQGQKFLWIEKTTLEAVFVFTIGGIAFWMFYIFILIEDWRNKNGEDTFMDRRREK